LRGAGAAAVGIPFLRSLPAFAGGEIEIPKRLVFFFTPHGTVKEHWLPSGGESSFNLGPILEPLDPFKDRLLVIDGVNLKSADADYYLDQHATGMMHVLTGTKTVPGGGGFGYGAGGISVDQHIADRIGGTTRFKSLELGVQTQTTIAYESNWSRINFRGPNEPVPPEDNPWEVFDRVFRDIDADPQEIEVIRAERRSVLDVVHQDIVALQSRLGREDRQLLEAHLDSVRDIETRIERLPAIGKYCGAPEIGSEMDDVQAPAEFPEVGRIQMDLLAMSLACDVTRVSTLQWSRAVAPLVYSWLDAGLFDGHTLSHYPDGNPVWAEDGAMTKMCRWYGEQFAYLLQKLDEIPEADGTILDHTLLVWCNELGKGNLHSHDVPWVLAGGGEGLRMGRFLEYDNESHNDLLVSICNAMGVPTTSFGDEDFCTGALGGLD
jgi:hypothetical protein